MDCFVECLGHVFEDEARDPVRVHRIVIRGAAKGLLQNLSGDAYHGHGGGIGECRGSF